MIATRVCQTELKTTDPQKEYSKTVPSRQILILIALILAIKAIVETIIKMNKAIIIKSADGNFSIKTKLLARAPNIAEYSNA